MNYVLLTPTEDYRVHVAMCPLCKLCWEETNKTLWNVASLRCPSCRETLAIRDTGDEWTDFHGDANGHMMAAGSGE